MHFCTQIRHLLLPVIFLSGMTSLLAQSGKIGVSFQAGLNNSDLNEGGDLVGNLLPREDYNQYLAGGDAGRGYFFGVGVEVPVYKGLYAMAGVNYSVLRYEIEAEVNGLRPTVIRPPSPDIIVMGSGDLDYRFIEIQAGINYHLSSNPKRGLFGSLYISHFMHLNRQLDIDLVYEDDSEGKFKDEAPIDDKDYNNLWMIGADVGVKLPLTSWLTVAPKFGFQFGLNPVVDDTLNPGASTGAIQISTWF